MEEAVDQKFNKNVAKLDIKEPTKVPLNYLLTIHNKIDLQPDFQREFVWKPKKQKELIKSIWMGIPLPLFYFSKIDDKFEVIDGQQRLTTLFGFLDKYCIDKSVRNKLVQKISLKENSKNIPLNDLKKVVANAPIYYVEINENELSSEQKYDLFLRLNQGAESLRAQEIRNCILQRDAPFLNSFLKNAAKRLSKLTGKKYDRMSGEELILRFLVINEYGYEKKVSDLISDNKLDAIIRNFDEKKLKRHSKSFNKFIKILKKIFHLHYFEVLKIDEKQPSRNKWESHIFTNKPNQGLFHLLSWYLPKFNIHQINRKHPNRVRRGFLKLLKNQKFVSVITGSGTDSPKKINHSKELFEKLFIKKYLGDSAKKGKRNISREAKNTLLENVPFCYLCYGKLSNLKGVDGEHISSYSAGNVTELSNALLSHKKCNTSKGKKSLEQHRKTPKSLEKRKLNKKNIRLYLKCLREWDKDYQLDLYRKLVKYAKADKRL